MDRGKNMFAALHINPVGERVNVLKQLSDDRGEAVSVVADWSPSPNFRWFGEVHFLLCHSRCVLPERKQ